MWQRFTVIILVALLTACHSSKENTISSVENKPELAVPAGYVPVSNTIQRTTYIGTADHPTIDGGIINAADGIPVSHTMPIETQAMVVSIPASRNTHFVSSNTTLPDNPTRYFEDSWATSKKVSALLQEAAMQGKLAYVLKKTNQMGLPASVAIVPMVESHYQIHAISPKGAAGAWQLMPAVAKEYGMQDQARFQFTSSTDTALQLLDHLHKQFGNWDLAFAAYNAGSGRVQTALRENPQAKDIDELNLPLETKHYVKSIRRVNNTLMTMEIPNA